jgi:hypothetical protein
MIPKMVSPAFENPQCETPTTLAAPVEAPAEGLPLALALASPLVLAGALSLIVPVDVDCEVVPLLLLLLLLLAPSGFVKFLLISSKGGLQMTISTLLLKHSPNSKKLCPSVVGHHAVQGKGLPIALESLLEQHAYMSQKAWSLTSASLLMTHPPSRPAGRSRG